MRSATAQVRRCFDAAVSVYVDHVQLQLQLVNAMHSAVGGQLVLMDAWSRVQRIPFEIADAAVPSAAVFLTVLAHA